MLHELDIDVTHSKYFIGLYGRFIHIYVLCMKSLPPVIQQGALDTYLIFLALNKYGYTFGNIVYTANILYQHGPDILYLPKYYLLQTATSCVINK